MRSTWTTKKGISLKEASNATYAAEAAVEAIKRAGFHEVQVYIDALDVSEYEFQAVAAARSLASSHHGCEIQDPIERGQ